MAESFSSSSRVRSNAGSCAVAAGLMIYFGFLHGIIEPAGADLFSYAVRVFLLAVRAGGIALAVLAALSLTGLTVILLVDAVVSFSLGAIFALTGVGMLIGGGDPLQPALNVIFGWLFVSGARRNWRDYHSLRPAEYDVVAWGPDHALADPSPERSRHAPPESTDSAPAQPGPAGPVTPARVEAGAEVKPGPARPVAPSRTHPDADDKSRPTSPPPPVAEPAPDGFLASFADESPPPHP